MAKIIELIDLTQTTTTKRKKKKKKKNKSAEDELPSSPSPPLREWEGFEPTKVDSTCHLGSVLDKAGVKDFWHKFIILGGAGLERSTVLRTVINSGYQTEFIPCLYRIEVPDATFLARGCVSTIHKLFKYKFQLMLDGSDSPDQKIDIELILCFAHTSDIDVKIQKALYDCVVMRYNSRTCTLDLSDFGEDPVIVDSCYFPLCMPKVMGLVLQQVKHLNSPIVRLLLNNNRLTTIKPNKHWNELVELRMIDLSENKLDSLTCLTPFQSLRITELRLDMNPLCEEFSKDEYIKNVCSYLPSLKKLDGVLLSGGSLPPRIRNYAPKESVEVVNQFMERFFTIYDSQNRTRLRGFYHAHACFSLTATLVLGQSTSIGARLTRYILNSRNLLKLSNYNRNYTLLNRGHDEILKTLALLPKTEHDPLSFAVDTVLYNGKCAVFTVNGLFREYFSNSTPLIRSFSRSFVLTWIAPQKYMICNEMLYISNATTEQAKAAFSFKQETPCWTKVALSAFEPLADKDKDKLSEQMAQITEMNVRWARKCLEESKWQFREALQMFTELLKKEKIPPEAFIK